VKRAAILIGVDRTGGLPELAAAARSAEAMYRWARSQDIDAKKFTDASRRPVDAAQLLRAISDYVDAGVYEQLLVYFAGHGINLNYSEYWLLSAAPKDAQAAVNMRGSALQAAFCGIPHVVMISDACRTFAESRQMHGVTGSVIFPNDPRPGRERPVDLFYACTLGRAAYEVRAPDRAAASFSAVYTGVLLAALRGDYREAVDWRDEAYREGFVRPRALRKVLDEEVPQALARAGVAPGTFQEPDAHIVSDGPVYLAHLVHGELRPRPSQPAAEPSVQRDASAPAAEASTQRRHAWEPAAERKRSREAPRRERAPEPTMEPPPAPRPKPSPAAPQPPAAGAAAEALAVLLRAVMDGAAPCAAAWRTARREGPPRLQPILDEAEALLAAPHTAPERCGFAVRSAGLAAASAGRLQLDGSAARVDVPEPAQGHLPVLLEFAGGQGTLLPALARHAGLVAMDGDADLVALDYVALAAGGRLPAGARTDAVRRQLRALMAAALHAGLLRLEDADIERLLRLAGDGDYGDYVDPVLALYGAYAAAGSARAVWARALNRALRHRFGGGFLDLDMLGYMPGEPPAGGTALLLPFPARAAGWALMPALGIALPAALAGLERTLADSSWTLFGPDGVRMLRHYIEEEAP
jgi:hypothetical protein